MPFTIVKKSSLKTYFNKSGVNQLDNFCAEIRLPDLPVRVHRRSLLTGRINHMDLPVALADLSSFYFTDKTVSEAFPQLTIVQRLFLATGMTQEEVLTLAAKITTKREKP